MAPVFGEEMPYVNYHDLNLDWIIKTVKEVYDAIREGKYQIKFANPIEWDIDKGYEQYTVVLHDDIAYLSQQPVPVGTDIENTMYWLPIYDMSELLEEVDAELALKVDKASIYNDLDSTDANQVLAAPQGKALADLITALASAMNTALASKQDKPSTRKVLYCGDSYSVWYNNNLFNAFLSRSGIPAENVACLAVSGASFNDASNNFKDQIAGYTGDRNAITDIIVAGGINDALIQFETDVSSTFPDMSDVTDGIDAFITYAHQNYPNALINIAYIGGCLPDSQYWDIWHPNRSQECALFCYTVYASSKGCRVLNTQDAIHLTPDNYGPDGLHPSTIGQDQIGNAIADAFNDRFIPYNRPRATYSPGVTGIVGTTTMKENIEISNGTVEVVITDGYMGVYPGEKISNTYKPIMTLFNKYRMAKEFGITGTLTGFDNVTDAVNVPMKVKVENGTVYVAVMDLDQGAYKEYTANASGDIFITIPVSITFTCNLYEIN